MLKVQGIVFEEQYTQDLISAKHLVIGGNQDICKETDGWGKTSVKTAVWEEVKLESRVF